MKPSELSKYLEDLIHHELNISVMIWGPPGVGKSSIVQQVAKKHGVEFVDLRLSQLAPTDLRGIPVPGERTTAWVPPDFLPQEGRGILFLDEINMAPPAMQGVAQQLILDRRVGSYQAPEGWYIWAAGNRKEDHAAVFDMPSPLANRFLHLDVYPSDEDFRHYAYRNEFHDHLISFVAFRQDLLHKPTGNSHAWPSPRSWEMANHLYQADLEIGPAVGDGPAAEFYAYLDIINKTPNLDAIIEGKSKEQFPEEPSLRYASVMGLVGRVQQPQQVVNCFYWLIDHAPAEWTQLFSTDIFPLMRATNQLAEVHQQMMHDPKLRSFLEEFSGLMAG